MNTGLQQGDVIVAEVGPDRLFLAEARSNIPEFLWKQDSVKALSDYTNRWVKQSLLSQEARRIGLDQNPEIVNKIRNAQSDILNESFKSIILSQAGDHLQVTMDEVRAYYESHRDQFVLEENYIRFRHLVTATLPESRSAKEDLLRGIPWVDVVEKYAINKSETLRNETRFHPVSIALRDVPVMQEYIRLIGIREISAIRAYNNQFHFIQILEERPKGDHPDIEWVLDKIKEWLVIEKRRKYLSNFEQNLFLQSEANNEIQIHNVFK